MKCGARERRPAPGCSGAGRLSRRRRVVFMPNGLTAFLVLRRDAGFGDVFQLRAGQRCTLGRATTNRVVLKDDMCSREHAEVLFADQRWYVRDLGSLNGTRHNGKNVSGDAPLSPRDLVELGNTSIMFVEELNQLPEVPKHTPAKPPEKLEIRQRLSETHYLPISAPVPKARPAPNRETAPERDAINRNLARLYRLALEMGRAETQDEPVAPVLDGLLELVKAEVGAVLFVKENRELEVLAHKHRDDKFPKYQKVSQDVSHAG